MTLPIGVVLGSIGVDVAWWLLSARRLEDAGYRAVWCWDHFMSRGTNLTAPVLEAWTTITAAAAVTERITVGTYVANVMNRHPAVLARMAATLQQASGGRLVLGFGIGGHPREHEAYGIPFPPPAERAARLAEGVAVIRALWAGGPASLEGRFYPLREAWAFPVPEPLPRILIGAGTPAGIRVAVRVGDGWAAEVDRFAKLEPHYREALERAGRQRHEQHVVLSFGGGRAGVDALGGSPWVERPREELEAWRERGADEIAVTARTTADVDALVGAVERW